jgi:opacity protein-like surface antigen
MKKFFLAVFIFTATISSAQFEDIFASEGDANKYVTQYMSPFFDGLMYSASAGWANSAKPLKPFSFSLDLGAAGALIPSSEESFTFNNADYQFLRLESGPNEIPTVVGGDSHSTLKIVIPINGVENKVLEFDAAGGIKNDLTMAAVALPKIQLNMGLPLGTEVSLRYFPRTEFSGDAYAGMLGIGIKHSLSQYIPAKKDENGKKMKRHFNLAVQASYESIDVGTIAKSNDKSIEMSLGSINLQGIASLDYKFLTLYSAIGYTQGNSSLDVKGTYEYTYDVQDNNGVHLRNETVQVVDPLSLEFEPTGFRGTFGVRLNLFFFRIFADYTIQKFPTANVGIGFKI